MKILALRLASYGPFTDTVLDFSDAATDFHLVFGPNEAGKSSALRALRHMLFGIPPRTGDNFRHPYPQLRIGARLAGSDGRQIDFLRRKGQVKTLRSADDAVVLPDDALAPFLGGADQAVFEQMFAIGHEDLVRGGQEIVCGKGHIGEALFAAGAGLIRLQAVQQKLEQDCAALFKPGGSTPQINQALTALREIRKKQKEALLQETTWQTHHRALAEAQARMYRVRQALAEAKQQVLRLQRIRDGLPAMARRKEIDADLADLASTPDLADDFGEKRREAERDLSVAVRDLQRARQAIEGLGGRIAALAVPETLIQQAAAVEALQHELGSYRKAQKDRPGLEGRMRTLQQQATDKLARVGSDKTAASTDAVHLSPSTVAEIQALGNTYQRLVASLESARTQRRKVEARIEALQRQRRSTPSPVDATRLEAAVEAALAVGPIDKRINELQTAVGALDDELARGIRRQSLWQGAVAEIDALPWPTKESLDRFQEGFDGLERRMEKLQAARADGEAEILRLRADLAAVDSGRQVPTEVDLAEARSLRHQGWGLIRRCLAGEAPPPVEEAAFRASFQGATGLPEAFEASMRRADHVADRLWHEAEQVSRKGLLAAREKQLEQAAADIAGQMEAVLADRNALEIRWQALWQPVHLKPLSPAEMRAWLSALDVLRAQLSEQRHLQAQLEGDIRLRAELDDGLRQALAAAQAPPIAQVPLSARIQVARAHAREQRDREARIAAMDKELGQLAAEREETAAVVRDLETALDDWQQSWHQSVTRLGISAEASPTAALAVIDNLKEARNQIAEAEVLRKRIDGIDRDAAAFQARVEALIAALAPDLAAETLDRAAELLNARLTAARESDGERRGLKQQLTAAQKERGDAERRISRCTAVMEALCREAGGVAAAALGEVERRAQTRKRLTTERRAVDQHLLELSAGATVADFMAEAARVAADGIGPEIEDLETEIQRLEQERSVLDQTIGIETSELKRMDGSAEAAGCAEAAEALLARLEADVMRYARVKIAAVILAGTVEQYREKHQGPLVSRAGALFGKMTLGAFDRLRAEYDEKGNPVMVGIRAGGGEVVPVEGMSDGTADQLYLALRLASLERYLAHQEPLPFVVDDILLRFDDGRALATLEVLADLAGKTQVIFFTHHRHLVDLATAHLAPSRIGVHRLGA
ncbi:MAG: AAA family ATPase [Desulfosarcinaceae bacterium]